MRGASAIASSRSNSRSAAAALPYGSRTSPRRKRTPHVPGRLARVGHGLGKRLAIRSVFGSRGLEPERMRVGQAYVSRAVIGRPGQDAFEHALCAGDGGAIEGLEGCPPLDEGTMRRKHGL